MAKNSREQKRRENQRRYDKKHQERQNAYIDGVDEVAGEFDRLIADPPVKGLLGLYQVDFDRFTSMSANELLEDVGLRGHTQFMWDSEYETSHRDAARTHGTGFVCATIDAHGRVVPVVFLCKEVEISDDGELPEEYHDSMKATIRLCVLLHELGHAEDVLKQVNFDHTNRKVDIIGAEAYAHNFVLQACKKNHYRLAMGQYVSQLKRWIAEDQTEEYVRLAAIKISEACDLNELHSISSESWNDVPWQREIVRERIIKQKIAELKLTPSEESEYRRRISRGIELGIPS